MHLCHHLGNFFFFFFIFFFSLPLADNITQFFFSLFSPLSMHTTRFFSLFSSHFSPNFYFYFFPLFLSSSFLLPPFSPPTRSTMVPLFPSFLFSFLVQLCVRGESKIYPKIKKKIKKKYIKKHPKINTQNEP